MLMMFMTTSLAHVTHRKQPATGQSTPLSGQVQSGKDQVQGCAWGLHPNKVDWSRAESWTVLK